MTVMMKEGDCKCNVPGMCMWQILTAAACKGKVPTSGTVATFLLLLIKASEQKAIWSCT